MKLEYLAVALVVTAFAMPGFAQDRPAAGTEAKKEDKKWVGKPHSHLEERHGIETGEPLKDQAKPAKKAAHSHPKENKQQ